MTSQTASPARGPNLTMACFCEGVLEEKDNVKSIIRVIDRLTISATGSDAPAEMRPMDYAMHFVVMLKSGSARGSHELKIEPEGPDGLKRQPTVLSVFLEGDDRGADVVGQMRIRWTAPGLWWFNIYVGDTIVTRVPFRIIYSRVIPGPTPGVPL
ncbi:MAG: hypothetical protein HY688_01875 [Chloroflexi bacterium]|nr:hypothetical protein [Chloroflexota bacterium]